MTNQKVCKLLCAFLLLAGVSSLSGQPQYNPNYSPGSGIYRPQLSGPPPRQDQLSPTERKINEVLDFWFGNLETESTFPRSRIPLWEGSPQTDLLIQQKFAADYQRAASGQYDSWRGTPEGRLALIILLDQIPRHLYANKPQMFQTDPMAKGIAIEGIQKEDDLDLYPVERIFFYMPFQHAEDPKMQAYSVKLFQDLVVESPPPLKPVMEEFLNLAITHQDIIKRFGRFPHRNSVLGRQSTPDEQIYLNQKSALRT